jgi:hypothetical protein
MEKKVEEKKLTVLDRANDSLAQITKNIEVLNGNIEKAKVELNNMVMQRVKIIGFIEGLNNKEK